MVVVGWKMDHDVEIEFSGVKIDVAPSRGSILTS